MTKKTALHIISSARERDSYSKDYEKILAHL